MNKLKLYQNLKNAKAILQDRVSSKSEIISSSALFIEWFNRSL
jgi:hypothetical protein